MFLGCSDNKLQPVPGGPTNTAVLLPLKRRPGPDIHGSQWSGAIVHGRTAKLYTTDFKKHKLMKVMINSYLSASSLPNIAHRKGSVVIFESINIGF